MRDRYFVIDYPRLQPSFWLRNPHLQTIATVWTKAPKTKRVAIRRLVPLADGDRLIIHDDRAKSWITGDRIAVLIHGLCGSHKSPYIQRIATKLRRHGIRTIRVDMRGFGDSTLISRGHLHAGRSDDIRDIVQFINHLSPLSKISLLGFSLGGNILLKYLIEKSRGTSGFRQPEDPVDSAISVSPPVDLRECSANLRAFGNRLYDHYFVGRLSRTPVSYTHLTLPTIYSV